MRDVSKKFWSLRIARASCRVEILGGEVKELLSTGNTEKGNIFEASRIAAMLGAKKTHDFLPFCHPVKIDHIKIEYKTYDNIIDIFAQVTAVDRTGVEMEALVAATIAALNIYDMLKPAGYEVVIKEAKLDYKKGGKSDFLQEELAYAKDFKAAVLVVSDSVYSGKNKDKSGIFLKDSLEMFGFGEVDYAVVSDDEKMIKTKILSWVENSVDLIITTGGTGAGPRDNTTEVVRKIIDRSIDGLMQFYRHYGSERNPRASLSSSLCGIKKNSLIVSIPGSLGACRDAKDSILPLTIHLLRMMRGEGHEHKTL